MFKKLFMVCAVAIGLAGCAASGKVERNAVTCALLGKVAASAVERAGGDVSTQQARDEVKLALLTALVTPQEGAAQPAEMTPEQRAALVNELLAKALINEKLTPADVGGAVYTACMTAK